jgi:hypothetical protein
MRVRGVLSALVAWCIGLACWHCEDLNIRSVGLHTGLMRVCDIETSFSLGYDGDDFFRTGRQARLRLLNFHLVTEFKDSK